METPTSDPTVTIAPAIILTNKVKNEEFKIWKKTVPSLYEHIWNLKPTYASSDPKVQRTIAFSDEIEKNESRGILTTSVLYAQSDKIYKIENSLPLGAQYKVMSDDNRLAEPNYYGLENEMASQYSWVFANETIQKIIYLRADSFIVISESGNMGWFSSELMQPNKKFVDEECEGSDERYDFDVSKDFKTVVKSSGKRANMIQVVNSDAEVTRRWTLPSDCKIQSVRFLDDSLFGACCDDNTIKFYDLNSVNDNPLWTLDYKNNEDSSDNLVFFEVSPLVNTLFATGSNKGHISLWDIRTIAGNAVTVGSESSPREIVQFDHLDNSVVADIKFSPTTASQLLTVDGSGRIYHWDLENLFSKGDESQEEMSDEEIQSDCLTFLHTGGFYNNTDASSQNRAVIRIAYHPIIDGLISVVNNDGLLTVYKAFTGKHKNETEENDQEKIEVSTSEDK